jgi:hypothetical protein
VQALGGRRFLLSLGSGGVTSALLFLGKLDGAIYRDVVLGTIGAYIVGNVVQRVKAGSPVTNNVG